MLMQYDIIYIPNQIINISTTYPVISIIQQSSVQENLYIKVLNQSLKYLLLKPKSNQEGLLKGHCIFCGKSRKRKDAKEEHRLQIVTQGGCDTLHKRTHLSKNEYVKGLILSGVDLIAKEAEYHKSYHVQFLMETEEIKALLT